MCFWTVWGSKLSSFEANVKTPEVIIIIIIIIRKYFIYSAPLATPVNVLINAADHGSNPPSPWPRGHVVTKWQTHVWFSTVALLPLLHEAVPALLPPDQVLHVGHVVQTHAPSLLEVVVQVAFAAAAEHPRERMPLDAEVDDNAVILWLSFLLLWASFAVLWGAVGQKAFSTITL